jgi:hypothetical protein
MVMFYMWLWTLVGLFYILKFCCPIFANSWIAYLLPALMWNCVILFLLEGYLGLIISVFLEWFYFDE